MDATAELGRNSISKHQIQPEYMETRRLTRDGTTEPVSEDQILRRERGQENTSFPCSADHVQGWQPYPVDPHSCYMLRLHTYTSQRYKTVPASPHKLTVTKTAANWVLAKDYVNPLFLDSPFGR